MSLRSLCLIAGLSFAVCLVSVPSAQAQSCPDGCGEVLYPEDGFTGWDAVTPGGPNPPTVLSCLASAGANQQCRDCYTPDPTPTNPNPSTTCGWVRRGASCKCTLTASGCTTEGSCRYE